MSKIKESTITFAGSDSVDVVGYRIYIAPNTENVTYEHPVSELVPHRGETIVIEMDTLFPDIDGVYNIGVVAVDDVGNESDMSIGLDFPLDFLAPNPPGTVTLL